jgi:sec-independent protein translocase protein TatB
MLSPSDTAIVFLLALLLFGPDQLPRIARQLGEAMRHVQSTTHSFMNEMERAARADEPRHVTTIDAAVAEPHEPPDVSKTDEAADAAEESKSPELGG